MQTPYMKTSLLVMICAAILLSSPARAEVKVDRNEHNLVASRLEGSWTLEPTLTKRLVGEPRPGRDLLAFRIDDVAVEKLSAKLYEALDRRKLPIYLAGYVTYRGKEAPFVLVERHGNSVILTDEGDAGVTIALGKDKQSDLLFFAEDYEDKQPFYAYQRIGAKSN